MRTREYPKLPIEEFGRQLIESGDLDPIYIALNAVDFDGEQKRRWMVAYWCFYHAGLASWLSEREGGDFWHWARIAANNKVEAAPVGLAQNNSGWPRGHERRHFRGGQGVAAIDYLQNCYPAGPEAMVDYLCSGPLDFVRLAERVQEHRRFGPWISFKIGDMIDRVLGRTVDFTEAAVFMFDDPVKAALMLWRERQGMPANAEPKDAATKQLIIREIVKHLETEFRDLKAPPLQDRPIGLQEVETVLCKWKSSMNGRYPPFNDIIEINDGLAKWKPHSEAAALFYEAMPKVEVAA